MIHDCKTAGIGVAVFIYSWDTLSRVLDAGNYHLMLLFMIIRFGPSGSTTCPTPNKVRRGAPLSTRSTPSKISRGENRTVFEVEQTKNWAPHTNCSTLAEMAIASIVHLYVFPAKPYELMGTTSLKIFQFLETILLIVLLSLM
nr:hypothetical protein CFP56_61819 [Quercus suber]